MRAVHTPFVSTDMTEFRCCVVQPSSQHAAIVRRGTEQSTSSAPLCFMVFTLCLQGDSGHAAGEHAREVGETGENTVQKGDALVLRRRLERVVDLILGLALEPLAVPHSLRLHLRRNIMRRNITAPPHMYTTTCLANRSPVRSRNQAKKYNLNSRK